MSYQWNARKARRAHLVKLGCVITATVACVGMPVLYSDGSDALLTRLRFGHNRIRNRGTTAKPVRPVRQTGVAPIQSDMTPILRFSVR